ncbi:MAG: sigma-54-dependent Fis family transcriptional regulator [Desulfobulbaceae bacterium]|uniref:Sigma-54-dependent Fis family transcriptional regulator n=1 Tax=Candidatus Desulfobia pelagia TaxID=2841692 RepID=A0A8J6TCT5_9BACT|nr:sigma-54-dependent Fis family transcriptional regulator [Candidatus Desulfobia pelagia]
MPTILVVDDELSMREFLKILLTKEGYTAETAVNGEDALGKIENSSIDLVISDIRMPGVGGLELLSTVKQSLPALPFIMITAFASPEDAVQAMKHGAYDYITKPFKVDEIKSVIRSALESKKNSQENSTDSSSATFEHIIGNSPEMLHVFDQITRVAPTHANVLIYGESGTGKELVAQAIHQNSNASSNHFVPIICNAIPETLFESELFGHIKGSFTGAATNKLGLLELADNGTAFLDEIGELSLMVQTKLLRFLQEREFKRVGDTKIRKVNVRIISATNRDLEEEILAKRFREDLFYRLAVVPLRMPPLRERKGDVPLLAEHFLKKYAKTFNKEVPQLSSYAMEVLMSYDFPGNVRELENIIERGVALSTSNIILPESLTLSDAHRKGEVTSIPTETPVQSVSAPAAPPTFSTEHLFEQGLEQIIINLEKEMIEMALVKANQSKMKAAELLKISFRSLRYKIKKYNID